MLKDIAKELSLSTRKVFMPVRVALTGKMHGTRDYFDHSVVGRRSYHETYPALHNSGKIVRYRREF